MESDGIPAGLFQILKDDAVIVLPSICQPNLKIWQWPQNWKMSVFIPIPKKDNAKESSNYHTIAFISHASKVTLKTLQASLNSTSWTSLVAQTVKRLPTMWETQVQSLRREDFLEKEMATHSSILAWKISWTEEPGRPQSMG